VDAKRPHPHLPPVPDGPRCRSLMQRCATPLAGGTRSVADGEAREARAQDSCQGGRTTLERLRVERDGRLLVTIFIKPGLICHLLCKATSVTFSCHTWYRCTIAADRQSGAAFQVRSKAGFASVASTLHNKRGGQEAGKLSGVVFCSWRWWNWQRFGSRSYLSAIAC